MPFDPDRAPDKSPTFIGWFRPDGQAKWLRLVESHSSLDCMLRAVWTARRREKRTGETGGDVLVLESFDAPDEFVKRRAAMERRGWSRK